MIRSVLLLAVLATAWNPAMATFASDSSLHMVEADRFFRECVGSNPDKSLYTDPQWEGLCQIQLENEEKRARKRHKADEKVSHCLFVNDLQNQLCRQRVLGTPASGPQVTDSIHRVACEVIYQQSRQLCLTERQLLVPLQPLFRMPAAHLFSIGKTRNEMDECMHEVKHNFVIPEEDRERFCAARTRTILIHRDLRATTPAHALCIQQQAGDYLRCLKQTYTLDDPKEHRDATLECDSGFWAKHRLCDQQVGETGPAPRRALLGTSHRVTSYQECIEPAEEEWKKCMKSSLKENEAEIAGEQTFCTDRKELQMKECLKNSYIPKDLEKKLGINSKKCSEAILKDFDKCIDKVKKFTDETYIESETTKCRQQKMNGFQGCLVANSVHLEDTTLCRTNANNAFLHCQYDTAAMPGFYEDLKNKKGAAFEKCYDTFQKSTAECEDLSKTNRDGTVVTKEVTTTSSKKAEVTKL